MVLALAIFSTPHLSFFFSIPRATVGIICFWMLFSLTSHSPFNPLGHCQHPLFHSVRYRENTNWYWLAAILFCLCSHMGKQACKPLCSKCVVSEQIPCCVGTRRLTRHVFVGSGLRTCHITTTFHPMPPNHLLSQLTQN